MACSMWTNYGLLCVGCSPKALDRTISKEEEPDPYYETYRESDSRGLSSEVEEEFDDE